MTGAGRGRAMPGNHTDAITVLNRHLCAAIDLKAQAKQAHWNIRGPHFTGLHAFFDQIAAEVEDWSDLLAERAAALGGAANGTVQHAVAGSYLPAHRLSIAPGAAHLAALSSAFGAFVGEIRIALDDPAVSGDPVTSDILTDILRAADQVLWKIDAHKDPA